jgi:hypothetical protein
MQKTQFYQLIDRCRRRTAVIQKLMIAPLITDPIFSFSGSPHRHISRNNENIYLWILDFFSDNKAGQFTVE